MATIAATGTWTDLSSVFDAAKSKEVGNEPRLHGVDSGVGPGGTGINLEVLKTKDGVEFSELKQFITLIAQNYSLFYWQAVVLVEQLMKALLSTQRSGGGSLGDESSSNRTYAP